MIFNTTYMYPFSIQSCRSCYATKHSRNDNSG